MIQKQVAVLTFEQLRTISRPGGSGWAQNIPVSALILSKVQFCGFTSPTGSASVKIISIQEVKAST
jgi:hypothetical protein